MTVQRLVVAFAGALVLLSAALAFLVAPAFLLIAVFVGANLLQSAFTRWCLLARILRRLGLPDEPRTWT